MIGSGAAGAGGAEVVTAGCSVCHLYRWGSTRLQVHADREALREGFKPAGQMR